MNTDRMESCFYRDPNYPWIFESIAAKMRGISTMDHLVMIEGTRLQAKEFCPASPRRVNRCDE
jgi:hypothetical protein